MLLPLLASLPAAMLTREFHVAFFNAIFSGLDKKSILSSKSERQSWITSLDECLRYLSTQTQEYVVEVVTSVHRTWLEKVLTDTEGPTRNHLVKYSAGSMASLVKYWLKQAQAGNSDRYDQFIRNFWQNVGSTLTTQIDRLSLNHTDIEKLMDVHILLLQTLKSSFTQELKKQHSIKFESDKQTAEQQTTTEAQLTEPSIIERYNHNHNELVQSICSHYFEFASKKQISSPVLSPLITLLTEFDSSSLFSGIARRLECESVWALCARVLCAWLAGDTMRCRAVVDIVELFRRSDVTCGCVAESVVSAGAVDKALQLLSASLYAVEHAALEARSGVAAQLAATLPPSATLLAALLSLTATLQRGAVDKALQLQSASLYAVEHAALEARSGVAAQLAATLPPSATLLAALLSLTATLQVRYELLAGAVDKALQLLSASLYAVEHAALEARSGVAAQLAATLPPSATLLAALLSLTATLQVRDAWQDGVTSLDAAERRRFLCDAAAMLHARLQLQSNLGVTSPQKEESSSKPRDSSSEFNISKIEHIVSLCPYLLWRSSELHVPEAEQFTRTIFDIAPPDPMLIEAYATRHHLLTASDRPTHAHRGVCDPTPPPDRYRHLYLASDRPTHAHRGVRDPTLPPDRYRHLYLASDQPHAPAAPARETVAGSR
ncbi:Uncharacterized protein OBRU01_03854 [Operophtera brumata]|uniref:E3 ubiquitin-protein ligase listerin n=1 Tax=Operophtera brumata TaxID=104452 RepID=A0A0L7LQ34_OPEBR|nr:Uncharacterized protein OBRU01_03854 [Operophtera brumata]